MGIGLTINYMSKGSVLLLQRLMSKIQIMKNNVQILK